MLIDMILSYHQSIRIIKNARLVNMLHVHKIVKLFLNAYGADKTRIVPIF